MRLVGHKVPFMGKWEYVLYRDFDNPEPYDTFVSSRKLSADEMRSVEYSYTEALDNYRLPV